MKQLTLIVHTDVLKDLTEHLRTMEKVPGFTFIRVEGHGIHGEKDAFLEARDKVVGHKPRVQVEMLLEDDDVNAVLDELRKTTVGVEGEGIFWLTAVDAYGRL